jgi:GDP-L-fucose synthase
MKVLVLGSNGLVGSSLVRILSNNRIYKEVIGSNREALDLFEFNSVKNFIEDSRPDVIINAAAKVGGILANNTYRADFILENLKININLLEALIPFNSIKLINLGSSCIYPLNAKNPIKEAYIMTGELEATNSPYAMAKLTAIELGNSLKTQYGHKVINLMPTNLYGPNDNFSDKDSHVIPGLMGRMHKTKIQGGKEFEVWGTGKPLREFLYVDDLANAISFIIENNIDDELINIGSDQEISIKELVNSLMEVISFKGQITFNDNYPDGNPRKLLDSSKISSYGWKPKVQIDEGLKLTYNWYLNNLDKIKN